MTVASSASGIDAVVRDYAFPDVHVGGSEEESPWVPFKGNTTFIRHLAFDVRNNTYANVLWVKQGGSLRPASPSRTHLRVHHRRQLALT